MAAAPSFTSTPRIGIGQVSTANTNRDGTGTIVDVLSAVGVTAGVKVFEVVVKSQGDPADSVVTLFLHDGTNYRLFDEIDLGDPAAASTTVVGYRLSTSYSYLVLPDGWKLCAAITVAPTAGVVNVIAFGGDLT
jgi:hypothetical protein